jgi:hypothetical protein
MGEVPEEIDHSGRPILEQGTKKMSSEIRFGNLTRPGADMMDLNPATFTDL